MEKCTLGSTLDSHGLASLNLTMNLTQWDEPRTITQGSHSSEMVTGTVSTWARPSALPLGLMNLENLWKASDECILPSRTTESLLFKPQKSWGNFDCKLGPRELPPQDAGSHSPSPATSISVLPALRHSPSPNSLLGQEAGDGLPSLSNRPQGW